MSRFCNSAPSEQAYESHLKRAAEAHGVANWLDLYKPVRTRNVSNARSHAWAALYLEGFSISGIKYRSGFDHKTILHHLRRIGVWTPCR